MPRELEHLRGNNHIQPSSECLPINVRFRGQSGHSVLRIIATQNDGLTHSRLGVRFAFACERHAAEPICRLRQRGFGHCFITNIQDERKSLAAGAFDLVGSGIDRARKLRMRFFGFRRYCDVGPVARGAQCDCESDAARGAGDEQGFARK